MKLFEFFQFEKYIHIRNAVQISIRIIDRITRFEVWLMGLRYRKMAKKYVKKHFRSSRTKIQCTRSGWSPVAIIWHGSIHEIVGVNYHIENVGGKIFSMRQKMSSIYHYHFYADVYECICVTQACDTTHILVFGFH